MAKVNNLFINCMFILSVCIFFPHDLIASGFYDCFELNYVVYKFYSQVITNNFFFGRMSLPI